MDNWTIVTSTVTAAFLASLVEVVEAFTIVLAVGITSGWRPAFIGTGVALAVLCLIVIVFGPLLSLMPIAVLQFVVGLLLGLFGLRWLRKAILRASGYIPLHDEQKAFAAETAFLSQQRSTSTGDYIAGLAAFKAVLLEGVEVVFIVIAVGTGHGLTLYAAIGAVLALILIGVAGLLAHKPLSRVPENTLKLIVGLMLTSFSVFWVGEGLGIAWPGADLIILVFLAIFTILALGLIRFLRSVNPARLQSAQP